MQVVFSDTHRDHAPETFLVAGSWAPYPEVPARADALVEAARAAGHPVVAADRFGPGPRAAVHAPDYLRFLESAHTRWQRVAGSGPVVMPNTHPGRHMTGRPDGVVGQAGYYMADLACPIMPATWATACAAADAAVHAASLVLDGAPAAYAAVRPPGHHAARDTAGGFCYLNNTAIAAEHLASRRGRVAILDVDVHHGNGTQAIFYDRGDVLTISLHADPIRFYPFYSGYSEERGRGAGLGCNLNVPLTRGSGDDVFLAALDQALGILEAFDPQALVIALGFDAYENDPFAGLAISTEGFGQVGRRIGALDRSAVLIQEGGYNVEDLGANLVGFLKGFEEAR